MIRSTVARINYAIAAALGAAACSDGSPLALAEKQEAPIVGGNPDTTSRSILAIGVGSNGLCSGTLILPNLVLTARHCVADRTNPNMPVQCGTSTFGLAHATETFAVSWDDDLMNGATPG